MVRMLTIRGSRVSRYTWYAPAYRREVRGRACPIAFPRPLAAAQHHH